MKALLVLSRAGPMAVVVVPWEGAAWGEERAQVLGSESQWL